jgi:hypothetical protein
VMPPVPQAKEVYRERSPIHALDRFTRPVAFFQVSSRGPHQPGAASRSCSAETCAAPEERNSCSE